ncbi:NAD(P)H-dependent oxidoreductase [Candidatus Hepatincolaceae symbiont of Richtersius coronifer]
MKSILLVVGHNNLDISVANKGLLESIKGKQGVTIHNLHEHDHLKKLYFNDEVIKAEQEKILQHNIILFQFPVQWYSKPAILKMWTDNVLAYGFAHGPNGDKLVGKAMAAVATTGVPTAAYTHEGYNKRLLKDYFFSLEQMAQYMKADYKGFLHIDASRSENEENHKAKTLENSKNYNDFIDSLLY